MCLDRDFQKCHPGMESVKPWVGHSNRLRHRRVLKRTYKSEDHSQQHLLPAIDEDQQTPHRIKKTLFQDY